MLSYIEDQIQHGIYLTETIQEKIPDVMTGTLKTVNIVKSKSEFPDKYTIEFLGECRKEEVVEVLFWLIHKFKHGLSRDQVEMVGVALRDSLYSEYHQKIKQNISNLYKSEDKELQEISRRVNEIIVWA